MVNQQCVVILYQRKEFIDLLIMNGFLMQSFLTVKNLRILYQEGVGLITESKINTYTIVPYNTKERSNLDLTMVFRLEASKNYKGKSGRWWEQVKENLD